MIFTYDPKKFLIAFAAIPLTDFAEGSFLEIEADEDSFTESIGASGEVVRVLNRNAKLKATVHLMQHSQTNDALSAIHASDRANGNGVAVFSARELNGTTEVTGDGWIVRWPNIDRAKDANDVAWSFTIPAPAVVNIGGLVS